MPIDVQSEVVLSLNDAAKVLPAIDGKRPHISTLWRWCRKGLRGVHLEYARYGNRIVTSSAALSRFVNNLASADTCLKTPAFTPAPKLKATEKRRAQEIQHAKDVLSKVKNLRS